jgi:predicted DNA-binding WGR domain protein
MTLRRRDPARDMARFYRVALQGVLDLNQLDNPDAPRAFDLVREWGKIGSPGTLRTDGFATEADARAAGDRAIGGKRRRGYRSAAPWG